MLLISKKDDSGGIKTLEVYSSYITLASIIFKQTKTLICVMVYNVEKVLLFEMRVSFLLLRLCKKYTSFLNEKTCRVSAKYCFT